MTSLSPHVATKMTDLCMCNSNIRLDDGEAPQSQMAQFM